MDLWMRYVARLVSGSGATSQAAFADEIAGGVVSQSTVSRWLRGVKPPRDAAEVAEFARAIGRNPLEAFVAAEMLDLSEAGRGLLKRERELLQALIDDDAAAAIAAYDAMAGRPNGARDDDAEDPAAAS